MVGHRRHVQNAEETDVRERDLLDIEMDDFRRQMQELQQRLDSYENHVADVENDSENGSSSGNEDDVNPFHRIPECDSSDGSSSHYQRRRSRHRDSDVKVDIPEFEGKMQLDDFIDWLQTVERVFDVKEFSD